MASGPSDVSPEERQTPPFLVKQLQKLSGCHFASQKDLNQRIDDITSECNLRFHAYLTGASRTFQRYACDGRKFGCQAYFQFSYSDGVAEFVDCQVHHNHDVRVPQVRRRYIVTTRQRQKIARATRKGQQASQIRLTQGLTCSKDVLYSARRPVLQQRKEDEVPNLLAELNASEGWDHVIEVTDNKIQSLFAFNKLVCSQSYCRDLCVIDDTACTNHYGLPLFTVIVEDQNARSQLAAFAVTRDRTKDSIMSFLSRLKEHTGDIRLFVMDRNKTQASAVQETFPQCSILYCAIHIGRNIKSHFGPTHCLYRQYKAMRSGLIAPSDFSALLMTRINPELASKNDRFLHKLVKETARWLPSETARLKHRGNDTSNRVEGFFGSLKNLIDHKRVTLATLVRAMLLRATRMRLCSLTDKSLALPPDLLDPSECMVLGTFAAAVVLSEYDDINLRTSTIIHDYCDDCCIYHQVYGLPCRHLLLTRIKEDVLPLLTLSDFDERWIHDREHPLFASKSYVSFAEGIKTDVEEDWSYESCIARFEKYFNIAKKSADVQQRLRSAIDSLLSLEHEAGLDHDESQKPLFLQPPSSLALPGVKETHPRRNVDKHAGRRRYKCSHCHQEGHTRPTCPLLAEQVCIPADYSSIQ